MIRLLTWLQSFLRQIPGKDGVEWIADDPHDAPDPQTVTRVWGGGIEMGEIK